MRYPTSAAPLSANCLRRSVSARFTLWFVLLAQATGLSAVLAGASGVKNPGRVTTIVERNLAFTPTMRPPALPATTFTVNDLGDTGDATPDGVCDDGMARCTLRAAIQEANSLAGADTINFSVTGTIQLGSVLPALTDITINGPGADLLTVRRDTGGPYRIFTINPGVIAAISGLTIANGNLDVSDGGGILNNGTLTITNSTLSGNASTNGGGIYNSDTLTIIGCTLSGNSADALGGGIFNLDTVRIINSTLSGNSASQGGGILNQGGTVTITNSTLSGNSASSGGGILHSSVSTLNARSTIIAQNTATTSGPDVFGTLTSQGHNLIGNNSGATITPTTGDQIGTSASPIDPKLGLLASQGGPTQTRVLLPGSPAIDGGDDCVLDNSCSPTPLGFNLTTDQRGFARQAGVHVDIGAFEVQTFTVNDLGDTGDSMPEGACDDGSGKCTLREAIQEANFAPGTDTINFAGSLTGTIQLGSALPALTDITVNGPGANLLTVRRNTGGPYLIFQIGFGVTAAISSLTITNGTSILGGGIFNSGTVTITNSTLSGNSVSGAGFPQGGGIFNNGTVTITNSTLSGNSASGGVSNQGGGIFNQGGTVTITNSTLSGNSVSGVGDGNGGGIFNQGGTVTITNSTLSGNSASTSGGGIFHDAGTVNARSTIIAQNTATTSGPNVRGTLISQGHNLIGNNSGATVTPATGDQIGTSASPIDPKLGPLANNGGPTQTRALLPSSPAIDAGDDCVLNDTCSPALGFSVTTDQRGFGRPVGVHVDIGAFEVQTFTVNDLGDTGDSMPDGACADVSGKCTLREAIQEANFVSGAGTINFADSLTGTIQLGSVLPDLSTDITINGPGANELTVRRNTGGDYRIFTIDSGVAVALSGLTIANGRSTAGGGVIQGGGILNIGGILTITGSTLSGNSASGTLAAGGGIYNNLGTVTITNSTLSGNSASGSFSQQGGGIYNSGGTLTITNSTLSGNSATGGGENQGGGILNALGGTVTITNGTLSGNSADLGGGIRNDGGATVNTRSTIIAQNTASTAPDVSGILISQGHNLIGNNSGAPVTPATGDQIGTSGSPIDPKLGPLASNGGPTPTRALLPGSTAIDAGDDCVLNDTCSPALGFNLTTDQRGLARPAGVHVDIGAVEVSYSISATAGTPQSATINSAFATLLQATVTESGNVQGGIPVTFTPPASGASGNFSGSATVNTNGSGVAPAPAFTANGTAGSYNLIASLGTGVPAASFALTNTPAATTTTVSSSVNPSNLNQSVTFTATVSSVAGTPTGTVQFKDGGTNLGGPQMLNGSGVATFSTTTLVAGIHTITADYNGDGNFLISGGTLAGGQQVGSIIKFSSASYNTTEGSGFTIITVQRIGNLSQAVTVDYATPDDSSAMTVLPCATANGVASPRCDFTTALGTLRFAAGDGADKTFTVLTNQDSFVEGPETLTLTLSNLNGAAVFTTPGATSLTATLMIADDLTEPATNPLDDTETFVRQQYHDFLNREPDASGLAFWKDNIDKCNDPARRPPGLTVPQCLELFRTNTSAAFFLSIEFQDSGYYVERIYKTAFADIGPPTVPVPVRFTDFVRDAREVGAGVIVGQGDWQLQLDTNKSALALLFVQRPAFLFRYPAFTSATAFVDTLNANAGGVLSDSERSALIAELSPNRADPALRAGVLRKIADHATLQQREFSRAFVLMQYVGYLRRNPDAAPEQNLNFDGYNFWLNKLNQFNGDFIQAEMVKAFINSTEYRQRFGP